MTNQEVKKWPLIVVFLIGILYMLPAPFELPEFIIFWTSAFGVGFHLFSFIILLFSMLFSYKFFKILLLILSFGFYFFTERIIKLNCEYIILYNQVFNPKTVQFPSFGFYRYSNNDEATIETFYYPSYQLFYKPNHGYEDFIEDVTNRKSI